MADEYAQVQRHLEPEGLKITTGTIVDTTAPSSTKNAVKMVLPSLRQSYELFIRPCVTTPISSPRRR
jgi:hypothetical protein